MVLKITSYRFGEIKIDGKVYTSDVIIFPNHVQANWWRKEGHRLSLEDLDSILSQKQSIDLLLVGTGAYGAMKVPQSLITHLRYLGIKIACDHTKEICEKHNIMTTEEESKIVTALHLTC